MSASVHCSVFYGVVFDKIEIDKLATITNEKGCSHTVPYDVKFCSECGAPRAVEVKEKIYETRQRLEQSLKKYDLTMREACEGLYVCYVSDAKSDIVSDDLMYGSEYHKVEELSEDDKYRLKERITKALSEFDEDLSKRAVESFGLYLTGDVYC